MEDHKQTKINDCLSLGQGAKQFNAHSSDQTCADSDLALAMKLQEEEHTTNQGDTDANLAFALAQQELSHAESTQDALTARNATAGSPFPLAAGQNNPQDGTLSDERLARALQQQEDRFNSNQWSDQSGEDRKLPSQTTSARTDQQLAIELQKQEYGEHYEPCLGTVIQDADEMVAVRQANREIEAAMNSTWSGKAWQFVEKIACVHHEIADDYARHSNGGISCEHQPVAVDDMVEMAERLFQAQATFGLEQKPTRVDVGYHYTRDANLERIRENGLLTLAERQEKGIDAHYNGSSYGDGVYTASNPYSYTSYGEVGLLVARLKGRLNKTDRRYARRSRRFGTEPADEEFDTATVNAGNESEMIILRSSYQCLPLSRFPRSSILASGQCRGHDVVYKFHKRLQSVIDEFFNAGQTPTEVKVVNLAIPTAQLVYPVSPSLTATRRTAVASIPQHQTSYSLTEASHCLTAPRYKTRRVLTTAPQGVPRKLDCSPSFSTTHYYSAPSSQPVSTKIGTSPSGSLRVSRYSRQVRDCGGRGFFILAYQIPEGVQTSYHPNPGLKYHSKQRCTFVLDNRDGERLVQRLVRAFCAGRSFVVTDDCNVELAIPHAIALHNLVQDFPSLLQDCNQAFTAVDQLPNE